MPLFINLLPLNNIWTGQNTFTQTTGNAIKTDTGTMIWVGGGATNIWAASTGLPGSTQIDTTFRNTAAGNTLNVAAFQNTSNAGYSAIRFVDDTGTEHGAVGYGNSGAAGAAFNQVTYLESFLPTATGTGLNAFVAINLVQSNASGQTVPLKITASRETWLAAAPTSAVGNVLGIRANSRTYSGAATSVSSLLRLEQLGDSGALVVYAPSASVTMTTTDGLMRAHIEHASSTAPVATFRNDGSGDWFQGQSGSNTRQFGIGYNGGVPNIFANGGVLQLGAANAASPATQTLQAQGSRSGTDSNTAGATLTIRPGAGTGTATGANLIFQTYAVVASGSGAQTATNALVIDQNQTVRLARAYTVATLPAAGTAGRMTYVTDANAPAFLTAVAGGGAVVTPVFDNGTNWVAF